jgi:hypothetical protein
MITATVSLTGYITALTICLCLAVFGIQRAKRSAIRWVLISSLLSGLTVTAFLLIPAVYNVGEAVELLGSSKSTSAVSHVIDLFPPDITSEGSSITGLLFGVGGFSEDFYWRILANFGVVGLLVVIVLLAIWCRATFALNERWRRMLTAWNIGVLIGSNGIAYLLTFPLGLIFWSAAAFLLYAGRAAPTVSSIHMPPLSPTTA